MSSSLPADKVRIFFRKAGPLRFLSHHDLMRAWLRMLRRAEVPVRLTQGFHPHPRLVFALSLPLGVVGQQEIADLELSQRMDLPVLHDRLGVQAPPGLDILSVERISPQARARVRGLCYAIEIPNTRIPELANRIHHLLAAAACPVQRVRPGKPARTIDLRPFLRNLRIVDREEGSPSRGSTPSSGSVGPVFSIHHPPSTLHACLEMELTLTDAGTARPEEVLGLLGLEDLVSTGVVERTRLYLEDQPGGWTASETPAGNSRTPQGPSEAPATHH